MLRSSGLSTFYRRFAAIAAGSLSILSSSGCTLIPTTEGRREVSRGVPVVGRSELREYRAVLHCHSLLSHDSEGEIDEIARAAADLGFDAVLLTDHYAEGNIAASPRGIRHGVLFVPGVELSLPSGRGSILVVGPPADHDRKLGALALAQRFEEDGALLLAGHIEELCEESDAEILASFDGFEVYNLHAQFKAASGWAIACRFCFLWPDRFFEASITAPEANLERLDQLQGITGAPAYFAGHDAHANIHILGVTIGTYPELFRLFSNRVLATSLDEQAIIDAVRRGHCYIVFDYLGAVDAGDFQFRVELGDDPSAPALVAGDEASFAAGQHAVIASPEGGSLRVVRDGDIVLETDARSLRWTVPGPGRYRVEVWRGERLWVLSSPIYLAPAGDPSVADPELPRKESPIHAE